MIPPGTNITSTIAPTTQPEVSWNVAGSSKRYSSGGGFSNVFGVPAYQSSVVAAYLKRSNYSYSANQYAGGSGKMRGFPDVAANGNSYIVAISGKFWLISGTSAAAPTFASLVTLINDQRLLSGKKPVGFLNPTLYSVPGMFKDVTSGNNPGCGTNGFSTAAGWDPVTGLGTPIYSKMLETFMNLKG